jgi:hypothetical protein
MLGVLAPGAMKPSDANVYNEEDWICYVAVVEEGLRRKLWREGSRTERVNLKVKNEKTVESKK